MGTCPSMDRLGTRLKSESPLSALAHYASHNHVNEAEQKHQERNLVDPVHDTEVHIAFRLLLKKVQRIEVVEHFF